MQDTVPEPLNIYSRKSIKLKYIQFWLKMDGNTVTLHEYLHAFLQALREELAKHLTEEECFWTNVAEKT
jgi:hypothetical protein